MSSWWLCGRTYFLYPNSVSKNGLEFGLVIDGDEFCVRLGESVGRLNLDTVLAGWFSQRLRRYDHRSSRNSGNMKQCMLARDHNIRATLSTNEQKTRAHPRSCASNPRTSSVHRQTILSNSGTSLCRFWIAFLVLLCNLLEQKCHSKEKNDVSAVHGCGLFFKKRSVNGTV